MEIALILVVLAALAAVFFLRRKKSPAIGQIEDVPRAGAGAPERAPTRPTGPTTQAETPVARRRSEAPLGAAPATGVGPSPGSRGSSVGSTRAADEDESPLPDAPPPDGDERHPLGTETIALGSSDTDRDDLAGSVSAGTREEGFVSVAPESSLDESPLDELDEAPPPLVRSPAPPDATRKLGLLSLRRGLQRSRSSEGFFGRLKALLSGKKALSPDIAEQIEEILLSSDVGVRTTDKILDRLKDGMSRGDLSDEAKVFKALKEEAHRTLAVEGTAGAVVVSQRPTVVLFVGVNGAGKTTTIGKLAQKLTAEGKKVMLSAGDTFRAAAVEQLRAWGERVGCEVVAGKDGADPSSVLFDAILAAKTAGADVLLADTAGRLHTKTNLMQEMTKIHKVAAKALQGAPHETLLVIDSTNGQNALAQAREFKEALPLTGLVLTKLDGTAKGGVVLGICDDLKVPVRYVGVGERAEDLHAFEPAAFVEALLGAESEGIAA